MKDCTTKPDECEDHVEHSHDIGRELSSTYDSYSRAVGLSGSEASA